MTLPKGLTLYVARVVALGDCTNGGITATHDKLTLVGTVDRKTGAVVPLPRTAHVFAASSKAPAVALENTMGSIHLVPVYPDVDTSGKITHYSRSPEWHMAGGNYASLGDSRAVDAASLALDPSGATRFHGAVSVHDRVERSR